MPVRQNAARRPGRRRRRGPTPLPPRIMLRVDGEDGNIEEHDMGYLLFIGAMERRARGRLRRVLTDGFDTLLIDPQYLEAAAGYDMDEFERMLAGFTKEILNDASRPFFLGHDPRTCGTDGCRMNPAHLLLAVLLYTRGMPVVGGLAAVLGSDEDTASGYLGYGIAVYSRVVDTPERAAARLTDALGRGSYGELEEEAPDLTLYIDRAEIQYMRIVEYDRQTGSEGAALGDDLDVLVVRTGRGVIIAAWEVPAGTSYLDALDGYVSGSGGFLKELARRLPDGRRWRILPGRFFGGDSKDGPGCGRHRLLEHEEIQGMGPVHAGSFSTESMMQLVWGISNSHVQWRAKRGGPPPQDAAHGARGPPQGAGPGEHDPPVQQAADSGNPYLEELIRRCSVGSPEEVRGAALGGLDEIICDAALLAQATGKSVQEFQGILQRFTEEIEHDGSRPLDPGGPHEPRHLLLMVLMNSRCGPVLDGLAAVFGVDHGTAAEYLEYGRSVCDKVEGLPDMAAARLADAARRGAYDEVERDVPGFALAATFERVRPPPRIGAPPGAPGGRYSRLMVFSAVPVMVGAWTGPEGDAGAEVFRRYISGTGRHLAELVRPLPDGRRWTVRYSGGLDGIEGLLPGADVGPADSDGTSGRTGARLSADFGGIRDARPGTVIVPEPAKGRADQAAGPGPLTVDPRRLGVELTCGTYMISHLGLEPGEDGEMLLGGRIPPRGMEPTPGGLMTAVLLQLRGALTLDEMAEFYGMDRGAALAGVRRSMDLLYDSLVTKPVDTTNELDREPHGTGGIRGDRLSFGCLTVPICPWRPLSGPHRKAIFVADHTGRIVGLGESVDGSADRRGMIRDYLSGRGRQLARLMESRRDKLTIYAGSRLVELEDELPKNIVKRYTAPRDRPGGIRGKMTLAKMAEVLASRDIGVIGRILDALDDYEILERTYDDQHRIVKSYDDEWYDLDRTLEVLCGMVNMRMQIKMDMAGTG